MARSYTAQSIIQLPILGASEASVLLTQLLTAASIQAKAIKGHELPPPIQRSRNRLSLAHAGLDEVATPQVSADTTVKRLADRRIDAAWSGAFDWLSGWCKLPVEKNPHLPQCLALRDLVFPDALAFTKLPYRIEWQESKVRLEAIDHEGHEKTFKVLGGAAFLANLTEAQEAYGVALGITAPATVEATREVRVRLLAALDAMRDYVNRVAAHAEPDVVGSEELTEALLLPLVGWETTQRIVVPEASPGPAPDPALKP